MQIHPSTPLQDGYQLTREFIENQIRLWQEDGDSECDKWFQYAVKHYHVNISGMNNVRLIVKK